MKNKNFVHIGLFLITIALFFLIIPNKESFAKTNFSVPKNPTSAIKVAAKIPEKTSSVQLNNHKKIDLKASAPVQVIIPSIGLNSKVLGLGVGKDGNLEVPSGKTNNVGFILKMIRCKEFSCTSKPCHNFVSNANNFIFTTNSN